MERLSFRESERRIERFGSREFGIKRLGRLADGQVVCVRLGAGGLVGRHVATIAQLFAVIEGDGWVAGGERRREPIAAGEAVVFAAGEEHESGTETGLVALVVESASLDARAVS